MCKIKLLLYAFHITFIISYFQIISHFYFACETKRLRTLPVTFSKQLNIVRKDFWNLNVYDTKFMMHLFLSYLSFLQMLSFVPYILHCDVYLQGESLFSLHINYWIFQENSDFELGEMCRRFTYKNNFLNYDKKHRKINHHPFLVYSPVVLHILTLF